MNLSSTIIKMSVGVMIGIVVVMGVMILKQNMTINTKNMKINTLESDKKVLKEKLKTKQSQLNAQNVLIAANASDPKKRDLLPIEITKIETKYVPVEKEIIRWREEANASDCDAAMEQLNNFAY